MLDGFYGSLWGWHLAGIAAALGDDVRVASLPPPGFGTTGTAHRAVA